MVPLLWDTLLRPDEAARTILARQFSRDVLWSTLALSAVLSVLAIYLRGLIGPDLPAEAQPSGFAVELAPFQMTLVIFALQVMLVFVIYFLGRALGGEGGFGVTLLAVGWTQLAFILVDLGLIVLLLAIPGLFGLAGLLALAVMFRTMVHFIAVAHGFERIGKAVGVLVLGLAGMVLGFTTILGAITAAASAMGGMV